jgi:hypothetical protein
MGDWFYIWRGIRQLSYTFAYIQPIQWLCLGFTDCSLSTHFTWWVSSPLTNRAQASTQGLWRVQPAVISADLRVCHEYFNLKWFHSYSFKEWSYRLTKNFIQIFDVSRISRKCGRVAALQPLWMTSLCGICTWQWK